MANSSASAISGPQLFGHPTGLFTLFFVEMWERFSYYGMRALLVFYMIKGFLGYTDDDAYAVYGAYTALVYAAPFIGGMLADRLLGARRAVIIGGLVMAAGQLLLTVENRFAFYVALGLLVCGNGFFKPNISTIVGSLYPHGSLKKDTGFTIFYMGINLGAALSPVICGYVGETFGWHWGFGLAAAGMLTGVAVFVAPNWLSQVLILVGALGTAVAMPLLQNTVLQLVVRLVLSGALLIAAGVAIAALASGGLPRAAGRPRDPTAARQKLGGIRADVLVFLGAILAIPIIAVLVEGRAMGGWLELLVGWQPKSRDAIAGWALIVTGASALAYVLFEALFRCGKIERERLLVALIMIFFSMLFWAFFEQAGSSLNNFADRNVARVFGGRRVTSEDVGSTITFRIPLRTDDPELAALPLLTQDQLGYPRNGRAFNLTELAKLRDEAAKTDAAAKTLSWKVTAEDVGMRVGGAEVPASEFQAVNAICILIFGLPLSALWGWLRARGWEPGTAVKFALGLLQLGLGFVAFWYGAHVADARGMVGLEWLLLGYLLHTTGELCLSPVGLSMITRLSPLRMASTMMGAWFMANAFSNYLAGIIARFTGVGGEGEGANVIPPPIDTVHVYGDVFGRIAIAAVAAGVICFLLSPLLQRWMHPEEA